MKAIESAYPQKDFITFAEKTSRYSRQISYFQNGRDMKNALHPPLTPCLLRQVRKQSGEWHSDLRYIHTEVLESTKKAAAKSRSTPDNC